MQCRKCGYVMQPFETECPRCAHMEAKTCDNCRRQGVVGTCRECGNAICDACSVRVGEHRYCPVCAPADQAAARSTQIAQVAGERPLPGPGFVRAVSLPGYSGLWGQVRRAFVFMRESLAMAFRDKDLILPPLLSVFASTAFLAIALLALKGMGLWEEFFGEEEGWTITRIVGGLLIAFIYYAISYFFSGMTVHLINVHLRGRDAQIGSAFADAVKNVGALLVLAGASAVVSVLTSRGRRRSAGYDVGDFVAGAVQRIWTVIVYLLLPIIMLEDVSFGKAISRGKEIHSHNLVPIAVGEIGVIIVNRVIGFIAMFLAIAAVTLAYFGIGPTMLIPALILVGFWIALVMAYTNFVRTAYYTCLYLWAVERAAAAEGAAVPQPLAAAMAA